MKTTWLTAWLSIIPFVLCAADAPSGTDKPETAVARLMADVAAKPPGPAENDVTSQAKSTYERAKQFRASMDDKRSLREIVVASYDVCTLHGPLAVQYEEGAAALCYGKARLKPAELAECKDEALNTATVTNGGKVISTEQGSRPMFGDSGLFSTYVGSKVPENGDVIATYCLVKQNGEWKVHGVYFSNDVLAGDDKDFVVRQLSAFAQKQ